MSDSWDKPRRVSVVVDNPSWILPWAEELKGRIETEGDTALLCRDHDQIKSGDVAFFLGCIKITPPNVLLRSRRNLVVHESGLPKGRGFSPLTWQIIEGANVVPICLLEASPDEVDAGSVIYTDALRFEGHELLEELRAAQGDKTVELCLRFLREPKPPTGVPQVGETTTYPRRRPRDSRLDARLPLMDLFPLLRVVDDERYPAFFDHAGARYRIRIDKLDTGAAE